jgi:hypothetical protein
MTDRPPRVRITIDRLVLRGFAAEQRDAIAAALTTELTDRLSDPANAQQFGSSRSLASLRAAPISLASPATPKAIGMQAARRLARSIQS